MIADFTVTLPQLPLPLVITVISGFAALLLLSGEIGRCIKFCFKCTYAGIAVLVGLFVGTIQIACNGGKFALVYLAAVTSLVSTYVWLIQVLRERLASGKIDLDSQQTLLCFMTVGMIMIFVVATVRYLAYCCDVEERKGVPNRRSKQTPFV